MRGVYLSARTAPDHRRPARGGRSRLDADHRRLRALGRVVDPGRARLL